MRPRCVRWCWTPISSCAQCWVRERAASSNGTLQTREIFVPVSCVDEAREHLPAIVRKRGWDAAPVMAALDAVLDMLQVIDAGGTAQGAGAGLSYERALFKQKCDNVFELVLDYASRGREWAA